MTEIPSTVPVLIIGGGPVGLALAGDLGWRGVSCLLVEKSDGAITQPRMDGVGVRTMEFCRRWGIDKWVEEAPYPRDHPQDNVYVTSMAGYELEREPVPAPEADPGPRQSPQRRERCPQDIFDPILKRFATSLPHVRLSYHTELLELAEDASGVTARILDHSSGTEHTVRADYVVGCDGAGSTVRGMQGITMTGPDVLTYSTNVIFRCDDLASVYDKPRGYRFICIGPEGTYATVVAINGRDRWRLSIIGDGSRQEVTPEFVEQTIRRAVGADFEFEVLSTVSWARREAIADNYGGGRIYLAGDAAHVMSPTGGLGMNSGIGDAVDLGWKLDAMLAGWGGSELLASYEVERRPVGQRNASESSENLRRLLLPREETPPAAVFEPGGTQERAQYGKWFRDLVHREWFSLGLHLGYEYPNSPICLTEPNHEPVWEVTRYEPTAAPGARAPHVWLDEKTSTLDLFGRGFVLLRIGADSPDAQAFVDAAAHQKVPLTVHALDHPDVSAAYQAALVLVRPDGFVAWRGDSVPHDPEAILAIVRGAQAQPC
ncbi:2-polyprenyl-6-methoxyphenol hydroxylase [Rhodococcus sp. WS4]|nr:2-polyprenyl-6-methoxyphenol hydroxylase [Rhodococcus sp. WS4]